MQLYIVQGAGDARSAVVGILSGGLAPGIKVGDGDGLLVGGNDKSLSKQLLVAFRQGPGFSWVSETKAHQMTFLRWRVHERGAGMHDGEVVDELDVAELLVQLDAVLLGELLYGFQGEKLGRSREAGVLEEWRPHELKHDSPVLVQESRHPVWCSGLRAVCLGGMLVSFWSVPGEGGRNILVFGRPLPVPSEDA